MFKKKWLLWKNMIQNVKEMVKDFRLRNIEEEHNLFSLLLCDNENINKAYDVLKEENV